MKAGSQATDNNGCQPRDRRAGAVQMEFVIVAVLIAAAVVVAIIFYGQTLRRQFSVASHAAAGKAGQAAKLQQESKRGGGGAGGGDFRKAGGAYGSKYGSDGGARTVDKDDLARTEKHAESPSEDQGETIQAPKDFGTNLTLAQTRDINEAGVAQEESARSYDGREKAPARKNILLWIALGVLLVGGLLVFLFTVRLR